MDQVIISSPLQLCTLEQAYTADPTETEQKGR